MKSDFYGYIANRCTFDAGQGQNCPNPRSTASRLGYCHAHQRHQEHHENELAREVTQLLLARPGGLANSSQVRATLANLFELISKNRIPPEKCGVLAYLGVSLLHSHERAEVLEAAPERRAVVLNLAPVAEDSSGELAALLIHGPLPAPETRQYQQPSHDREVLTEVSFLAPSQHSAEGPVIMEQHRERGRVEEHDERGAARPEAEDQAERARQFDHHRDPEQHGDPRQMPRLHVSDVAGPIDGLRDPAGDEDVHDHQSPGKRPEPFGESFHEQLLGGIRTPT